MSHDFMTVNETYLDSLFMVSDPPHLGWLWNGGTSDCFHPLDFPDNLLSMARSSGRYGINSIKIKQNGELSQLFQPVLFILWALGRERCDCTQRGFEFHFLLLINVSLE
jgi:hypothetical protein